MPKTFKNVEAYLRKIQLLLVEVKNIMAKNFKTLKNSVTRTHASQRTQKKTRKVAWPQ